MTLRLTTLCGPAGLALVFGCALLMPLRPQPAVAAEAVVAALPATQTAFLARHCGACHSGESPDSGVRLDTLPLEIATNESADRWQKVLNVLNSGEMPPEDEPQPSAADKAAFLETLAKSMVAARRVIGDQGRLLTIRRLNRREYQNTVEDLLGVVPDVSELPADGGAGAFDTVGSTLYMSSDQFEAYLRAGLKAIREAGLGIAKDGAEAGHPSDTIQKLHKEVEEPVNRHFRKWWEFSEDSLARYGQWTAAVDEAAARPEHVAQAGELRKKWAHCPERFYVEWDRLVGEPKIAPFGFKTGGDADYNGRSKPTKHAPTFRKYFALPAVDSGAYLGIPPLHSVEMNDVPAGWPAGRYVFRYRIAALDDAPPLRRFVQFGFPGTSPDSFEIFSTHEVTGTLASPQVLEIPVTISKASGRRFGIRERRRIMRGTENDMFFESFRAHGHGPLPVLWVDWVEIEGPLAGPAVDPPPAQIRVATQDRAAVKAAVEDFARGAFRGGDVSDDFIEGLVGFHERRMVKGDSFTDALQHTLAIVLASPQFLYVGEPGVEGAPRPLSGRELANRLAYFLWSRPPDAELVALGDAGELAKPRELARQVERLLASPKADDFFASFIDQWLGLERLDFFQFDRTLHPEFDDSMKLAARREVSESFALLAREGGSLRQLLDAEYVVVNGLLAAYYGLEGVHGDAFRKIPVSSASHRGGLLGMAGILAMGGNGMHTSPVERGAWVLRKVLDDPPPPPPPNIPQLSRLDGQLLTVRERVAMHAEAAQCVSCHRRIDPIGFGLENFDAAGLWRTTDRVTRGTGAKMEVREWDIDPSGELPDGAAFASFDELKACVAARPEGFSRRLAEGLVEYALGRRASIADDELIAGIVARAAKEDLSVRAFIQAVVASKEFQTK